MQVAFVVSLLIFGCMVHACGSMVMLMSFSWDLHGLIVVSSLPCHFLDNHDVVGSLFGSWIGSQVP